MSRPIEHADKANLFVRTLATVVDWLFRANGWILIALLTVMSVVMLIQVLSRYLFNAPLTWPEELGRYLFIWIVFLGAALAFRKRAHLRIEFISSKIKPSLMAVIEKVTEFIILIFLIFIIYISIEVLTITGSQKSPVLHIPMNYIYLAFPVASALMILDLATRWLFPSSK